MIQHDPDGLKAEIDELSKQIERLKAVNNFAAKLATTLDFEPFLFELASAVCEFTGCERAVILIPDEQESGLEFGLSNYRFPDYEVQYQFEKLRITTYQGDNDPIVGSWLRGEAVLVMQEHIDTLEPINRVAQIIHSNHFYTTPLMFDGRLTGLIIVDNITSKTPISPVTIELMESIRASAAGALFNTNLHRKTVQELAVNMREQYILRQIDRELNDTIDLKHVFQMTLDWALRFTNAQSASLALYNQDSDTLRFMSEYGYDLPNEKLAELREEYGAGIAHRVARSGYGEIVPDVSMDKDFVPLSANIRSQIALPVMREDRVIAIITLESKKINGFTNAHQEFVEKLATRAGVAIDNARLYDEALVEREKLSHILSNTADVVIVTGMDDKLILINQAALSMLQLYPTENYIGRSINDVFDHLRLPEIFKRAKNLGQGLIEEMILPDERTLHVNLTFHEGIGWIIVMHDITPFKEMDQLKSQLIATVSHDLKQPLSVMYGYIELLSMQKAISDHGLNFVQMIKRSIQNMRQLIDDLLDLAKIESGIALDLKPINLRGVIDDCMESLTQQANDKSMTVIMEISDDLPLIHGDKGRLRQILINLIGNAIKYTPPEGRVKISIEERGEVLRFAVQDNGLGISPEDQMHIFDRFYRVRRPETDSIEGTGLGLAIVKSLVEAHNGQIGLESRLGEGSTFYITLPVYTEPAAQT